MSKLIPGSLPRVLVILALLSVSLSGCIVHTYDGRPRHHYRHWG